MNPTRRGILGAAAALIAGGKTVAAEATKAVSMVGVGMPSLNGGNVPQMNCAIASPVPDLSRRMSNLYNRRNSLTSPSERFTGSVFPYHIAALKSVPFHTLARMSIEHQKQNHSELMALAVRLGLAEQHLPYELVNSKKYLDDEEP